MLKLIFPIFSLKNVSFSSNNKEKKNQKFYKENRF